MKFGAGNEIYGEGEPVEYVYEVVHGAVQTVKVLTDGRRTLGGYYSPRHLGWRRGTTIPFRRRRSSIPRSVSSSAGR